MTKNREKLDSTINGLEEFPADKGSVPFVTFPLFPADSSANGKNG